MEKEFESAKKAIEKEIREAIVFLREKNNTIPSETIEFMKVAALEKLGALDNSPNESGWLNKPVVNNRYSEKDMHEAFRGFATGKKFEDWLKIYNDC